MRTLEDLVMFAARRAADLMRQDGAVAPVAILATLSEPHTATVVALDFSSDEAKALSVEAVKQLARKTRSAVVFVSETWYTEIHASGTAGRVRPAESPDRKEAIFVSGFSPSGAVAAIIRVERGPDGTPIPGEPELFSGRVETWMNPWPDQEPVH